MRSNLELWFSIIKKRYLIELSNWRQLSKRKKILEPHRTPMQKYAYFQCFWIDAFKDAIWDLGCFLFKEYKIYKITDKVKEVIARLRSKKFWLDICIRSFYFFNIPKKPWRLLLVGYTVLKVISFISVLICFGLKFSLFWTIDYWWDWLTSDLEWTMLMITCVLIFYIIHFITHVL